VETRFAQLTDKGGAEVIHVSLTVARLFSFRVGPHERDTLASEGVAYFFNKEKELIKSSADSRTAPELILGMAKQLTEEEQRMVDVVVHTTTFRDQTPTRIICMWVRGTSLPELIRECDSHIGAEVEE
jgi:hypothetical protein